MFAKTNKAPLRVGGVDILPLEAVRDLGVVFDSNLMLKKHINGIVSSCFYQLRKLSITDVRDCTCTGRPTCTCIHSLSSWLLQLGVSDGVIRKLQSVLHADARLVSAGTSISHRPSWCTPLATSRTADHIQDFNDGIQSCSWYVPGVFLWRLLYASSDSCRTSWCQATLYTPWSPHCLLFII